MSTAFEEGGGQHLRSRASISTERVRRFVEYILCERH